MKKARSLLQDPGSSAHRGRQEPERADVGLDSEEQVVVRVPCVIVFNDSCGKVGVKKSPPIVPIVSIIGAIRDGNNEHTTPALKPAESYGAAANG